MVSGTKGCRFESCRAYHFDVGKYSGGTFYREIGVWQEGQNESEAAEEMKPLEPPDSMHLQAAHGWLELGNTNESKKELELIAASLRSHPDVLGLHWNIHENLGNWDQCVSIGRALVESAPEEAVGWIHRSFALHEMGRTREAYDELRPALEIFEKEQLIWYNMACYACCLDEKVEARTLLNRAIELGGDAVRTQALNDSDLRGVWVSEGEG